MTKANAEKFLEVYGNFAETMTAPEIAELGAVLDTLTGTTCGALEGADTLAGVAVQTVAAGTLLFWSSFWIFFFQKK